MTNDRKWINERMHSARESARQFAATRLASKRLADVWDEGWRAAAHEFETTTKTENPYRDEGQ